MLSVYFWSCSVDCRTSICDMQTPCHLVHFPIFFANGCIHTHPIGIRLPVINLKRYSMYYHVRNKINLLHIVKEVASPGSWYVTCVTLRAQVEKLESETGSSRQLSKSVEKKKAEEERRAVAATQVVTPPTTPRKEITIRPAPPKTPARVVTPLAQQVLKRNMAKRKEQSGSEAMTSTTIRHR